MPFVAEWLQHMPNNHNFAGGPHHQHVIKTPNKELQQNIINADALTFRLSDPRSPEPLPCQPIQESTHAQMKSKHVDTAFPTLGLFADKLIIVKYTAPVEEVMIFFLSKIRLKALKTLRKLYI